MEMSDYASEEDHELSLLIAGLSRIPSPHPNISLITKDGNEQIEEHLMDLMKSSSRGAMVSRQSLSSIEPSSHSVLAMLLELSDPFLRSANKEEFEKFRDVLTNAKSVLYVMKGGAENCSEPDRALITGLAHTLQWENRELRLVMLDLDPKVSAVKQMAADVMKVYDLAFGVARSASSEFEFEYAVRDGRINIPRVFKDQSMNSFVEDSVSRYHPRLEPDVLINRALELKIESAGLLDSLYWTQRPGALASLKPNQVRVELSYLSLNFRDLMVAMGQIGSHSTLLLEGSGTVVEVGDDI